MVENNLSIIVPIFEKKELNREGLSKEWIRLRVLQSVQAKTFLNSSGLICISEYAENYLKQFYPRLLRSTEVRRIPHGISKLRPTRREYKFDDRIRLLYVSTVKQYKHQWRLIDAVAQLRKEGFPLELHLVGSGDPPALSRMHLAIERPARRVLL